MHTPTAQPAGPLFLTTLAGAVLLASLGISVTTVALPTLATTFSTGVQQVQWVVLAYLLSLTVTIVSAGRLGDLYGNRRVLIAGLMLFTVASIVCALAPSFGWLIGARVAQGLAAAVLMALPMALAKGLVDTGRLGAAMGLLGSMSAIGTALGPSLGGALIELLGWRAVFALLVGCGFAVIAIATAGIPPDNPHATKTVRMDWPGSLWLCLALLFFALATAGGKAGMPVSAFTLLGAAAVALVAFVRIERRATHPLVPLALLGRRTLATSLTMNLIVGAIMMSTLVVGPFFLKFGLGLNELATGMVMAVGPAVAALSGVPAGRITDRFGTRTTLLAGLTISTGGLICLALLPTQLGTPGYVMALALLTPGFQMFLAANNTVTMADAADAQRGMVSGLLGLSRNLGFMTGTSLMPLLFGTLVGDQGVANSDPAAVGDAFSISFLVAAGCCALAIVISLATTARPRATVGR